MSRHPTESAQGLRRAVARHPVTTAAGVVALVAMLVVALWPTHVDEAISPSIAQALAWIHRFPPLRWFDHGWLEFLANVAYFVPLGALATRTLASPVLAVAGGALFSGCIELAQTMLPDRTPSWLDVLANTLGAIVGAATVWFARRRRERPASRART